MDDLDRELLDWLASTGSGAALRGAVAARFGGRVDDLGAWLTALEARGVLQVLDPFGTEERCVLTERGLADVDRRRRGA
jgi:hypothetical protein